MVYTTGQCPVNSLRYEPPKGYVYVAETGKYYRPHKSKATFREALEICHAQNSTLVEFRTPQEYQIVKQMRGEQKDKEGKKAFS